MSEYRFVKSSNQIAQNIADLFEDMRPFTRDKRSAVIGYVDDMLNYKDDFTQLKSMVLKTARDYDDYNRDKFIDRANEICGHINSFSTQKNLIAERYEKRPEKPYIYETTTDHNGELYSVITQNLYDYAVANGFSPGFFKKAMLEGINIYCLPENADFSDSIIYNCKFWVCAARGIKFDGARVYDSEFHTVDLKNANLTETSSFDHTHFFYFNLSDACLTGRFHDCNFTHGTMNNTDLLMLYMNGGRFADIQTNGVKNLDTAYFNRGGMTRDEVEQYRDRNIQALQPNNQLAALRRENIRDKLLGREEPER